MEQRARIGNRYHELAVDRKAHQKEPCHAAVFEHGAVRATHYCTEVTRHGVSGASELKGDLVTHTGSRGRAATPEELERQEKIAALEAIQERRREFVPGALRSVSRDEAISLFCLVLLKSPYPQLEVGGVAKVLGLDGTTDLENFADETAENRVRVLAAAAIDLIEVELDPGSLEGDLRAPSFAPYFDFLEAHGYEVSEIERGLVAEELKAAS
jgi:hypothetical protein